MNPPGVPHYRWTFDRRTVSHHVGHRLLPPNFLHMLGLRLKHTTMKITMNHYQSLFINHIEMNKSHHTTSTTIDHYQSLSVLLNNIKTQSPSINRHAQHHVFFSHTPVETVKHPDLRCPEKTRLESMPMSSTCGSDHKPCFYIYIYTHMYIYICIYIDIRAYIICISIFKYTYTYLQRYIYVYIYT